MKKLLLVTTALIALAAAATPANATLQVYFTDGIGGTFSCADGGGCDFAGPTSRLLTISNTVGSFFVSGTLSLSGNNTLTMSNFGVINNGATTGTLSMFVSDNGFTGPVTQINEAASLNFLNNIGAGLSTLSFFADNANGQGAPGTPGTPLSSFSGAATQTTSSFSGQNSDPFVSGGPYSMTSEIDLRLLSGGSVTGFNIGMQGVAAVPEPSTWAMMLLGFAGLAWAGMRRRKANLSGLAA